jgi:adenylate cyclase
MSKQQTQKNMYSSPKPPMGEISCIFTDIIDSTPLWTYNEAAMWEALKLHNDLMRKEMEKFGGYEVKSIGDAFYVVFGNSISALRFCLSAQLSLHIADWPEGVVAYHELNEFFDEGGQEITYKGITVRMGIHFGKPFAADMDPVAHRMDYYGPMINSSARVQSQAEGGEIAISDDFIMELWRCRIPDTFNPTATLTNELRKSILSKEVSLQFFDLKFLGSTALKGVAEQVYITLICSRPGTENFK